LTFDVDVFAVIRDAIKKRKPRGFLFFFFESREETLTPNNSSGHGDIQMLFFVVVRQTEPCRKIG
jgi:hypothetical protein